MNKPIVSIIIPVYNSESYVQRCINSILNQTFDNFEAIFVNDGSTDNSLEILKFNQILDNRIKIINQENAGTGEARNNGLKNALSEYILFVDSDDTIEPTMIEKMYLKALEDDSDIVICEINKISFDGTILKSIEYTSSVQRNFFDYILSFAVRSSIWDKIYKKTLFVNNNLYFPKNLKHNEDNAILFKLIYFANKISFTNEHLYNWFVMKNSKSNSISQERLSSIREVLNIRYNFLIQHNIYNIYENDFLFSMARLLNLRLQNVFSSNKLELINYIEKIIHNIDFFSESNLILIKNNSTGLYFHLIESIIKLNNHSILLKYFPTQDIEIINYYLSQELGLLQSIIDQIEKSKLDSFYIYGAGIYFEQLLPYFKHKYKILGVIDKNVKQMNNKKIKYRIGTIDEILPKISNANIIITSKSSIDEINSFLRNYSIDNNITLNIIHSYSFNLI